MRAVVVERPGGPEALTLRDVPEPVAGPEFEIVRTGDNAFRIRGEKTRRWIRQTDFSNDEAVGYLTPHETFAVLNSPNVLRALMAMP